MRSPHPDGVKFSREGLAERRRAGYCSPCASSSATSIASAETVLRVADATRAVPTMSRSSTTTSGSCTTPAWTGRSSRTSRAQHPNRLHELQRLFLIEATKNNVLPLDDRAAERLDPDIAGPTTARRA
jgi:hypothetical protein